MRIELLQNTFYMIGTELTIRKKLQLQDLKKLFFTKTLVSLKLKKKQ